MKHSKTILSLFLLSNSVNANISNIKGTYCILKKENHSFSIIHGAVSWETGTIRRMYDIGSLGKKGAEIESATIRLVNKIFYRPAGTISIVDFVLTNGIQNTSDKDIADFVADTVVTLADFEGSATIREYKSKYKLLQEAEKNKDENAKKLLYNRLDELKKDLLKHIQVEGRNKALRRLVGTLIESYIECTIKMLMPSYTPSLILQSMLWAKTRGNRDALAIYYKKLEEKKRGCLQLPVNWDSWKKDVFQEYALDKIKHQIINPSFGKNKSLSCFEYEKLVYYILTPKKYPPEIPYGTAIFELENEKKATLTAWIML